MALWRSVRVRLRRWLRSIVRLRGSSRAIAAGFALGLLIAWTPTIGIQMVIAGVLATLLRVNRIAAVASVWASNFVTALPMFSLAWRVGRYVLGGIGLAGDANAPERLRAVLTYDEGASVWTQTWQKLGALLHMGGELWVGGLVLGMLSAFAGYLIMLRLVEGQRLLAAQRRARRWQKHARR